MRKKWILGLNGILLVFALVISNPSAGATEVPESIKICSVLSLSGMYAPLGNQIKMVYDIYVDEVNSRGGIYIKQFNKKIPIDHKILDDESDGLKTILQLEVANQWGAVANLGGIGCTSFEVGTVVAEKNKMPWIGPGCSGWTPHQRGIKYMFATLMKTPGISPLVFDVILSMPEPRPKKVGIFEINQLDAQETVGYWRKDAEKGGFEIVYHQKYPLGTKDFSAMITGAKAAGAEIILAYPTPGEGIAMVKQMKELDYNPKLIYFVRAAGSQAFGKALGPLSDYIILPIDWSNQLRIPGNDEFNAEHQKRYGRLGDPFAGSSYVAAQVLGAAIQKAGTLDRKAIRDAIAATDMETIDGRVRFSPQGWIVDQLHLVLQWQEGKQNIVHYNKTGEKYKKYIPKVDMRWQPAWSAR